MTDFTAGNPALANGDTVYLTTADKDHNMVSLIQSNYLGFGSGLCPPELGFCLQNRGELFDLTPGRPNSYAPGKRPFHTIIPAFVTKDGQPVMSFGVMGGDMQPQGHVQILINLFDFGMGLQEAGDAPRVKHDGSSTPTGTPCPTGRRQSRSGIRFLAGNDRRTSNTAATESYGPEANSAATRRSGTTRKKTSTSALPSRARTASRLVIKAPWVKISLYLALCTL